MKSRENTKEEKTTHKENKQNIRTDEDLMMKLNKKIIHEEVEDLIEGNERVVLEGDEDYKEVDGIKMIPFSLDREIEESKFEKGNMINKKDEEEDEESANLDASESGDTDKPSEEKVAEMFKRIIDLVKPEDTIVDALTKCENDNEKLAKITDLASQLLFTGFINIYSMTMKEMEEKCNIKK